VCQFLDNYQYEIYYFHFKKPFYIHDIDKTVEENVIEETLEIPTASSVTSNFSNEEKDGSETMISVCLIDIFDDNISENTQDEKVRQQLSIFGYHETVNTFKQKYQNFFNQHQLTIFKIQINPSQVSSKNLTLRIS
jgi:hypothetical protein